MGVVWACVPEIDFRQLSDNIAFGGCNCAGNEIFFESSSPV